MRKKWNLGLMSLTILASSLMVTPAFCASNVKIEYANSMTQAQSNTISCKIKLTNTSKETVSLEDYTLRYYYTKDQNITQCMWCDNAAMIAGGNYKTLTQDVQGTFYTMSTPTDTADTYLELGFKEGSGELAPNGTVEIQLRITNSSWQNYNQANDFSYGETTSAYTEWANVPLYENGVLVAGSEPTVEGVVDSEVSQTVLEYDKNADVTSDIATDVTLNGNTLEGVKLNGVALKTTDYTLTADGSFAFSEDYLKTLEVGTYKYVFDFNVGKDVTVTLNVVDTTDYDFAVVLPSVTAKAGDTVTLLVNLQNVSVGINNADFTLALDTNAFDFVSAGATGTLDTNGEKASLMTSYHKNTGILNVMYADSTQEGENLLVEDGAFMAVKVTAKKDFTGTPLTLKKLGAVNDVNLNKIVVSFKTK